MNIFSWFLLAFYALILLLLFMPDFLPYCSCCGKLKPRPFFRIHRAVSLNPGYGGSRSVCTACCRKFSVSNLEELDKVLTLRQKLRLESLSKDVP